MAHLSDTEIQGYWRRTLPSAKRLVVSDHLATCEACRTALAASAEHEDRLARTCAAIYSELHVPPRDEAPFHLSDEQVIGFVEQTLNEVDQAITEMHVEDCERCATTVAELRRFQAVMSSYPAKEHAPAPRPTWEERFRAFLDRPSVWLQIHGVAAAAWLVLFWFTGPGLRARVAREQQPAQVQGATGQKAVQAAEAEAQAARASAEQMKRQLAALPQLQSEIDRLQRTNAELHASLQRSAGSTGQNDAARSGRTGRQRPSGSGPRMARRNPSQTLIPDGTGHLVPAVPPPPALKTALAQGRVPIPTSELAEIEQPSITLMGGDEKKPAVTPLAPVGQVIVADRPTFRWQALPGATHYQIQLFDISGQVAEPVAQTANVRVTGADWQPARPLRRGRTYEWEIRAFKESTEVGIAAAKFRVLEEAKVKELARHSGSLLTLGVLYAQAGLLDEAERAFQQVLRVQPDSQAAQKLLASLRRQRQQKP